MTDIPANKILIRGVTQEGSKFRPSDWAERLCGNLASFRNRRMYYSPLLRPAVLAGMKCVYVDHQLESEHPELFSYVMDFAKQNQLVLEKPDKSVE